MGLIGSIVQRGVCQKSMKQENLFRLGSIGLRLKLDKFDTAFDVKFSTYAVPMITGEIKRFLRDDGMIKVSRTLKENSVKMARMIEEYRKEHLCEPTVEQIAQQTGIPPEEVVMSFEAAADVESIYRTVYQGDGSEVCLIDKIEEKRNYNEESVNRMVIAQIMEELPEKERTLIRMRYFEEHADRYSGKSLESHRYRFPRMEENFSIHEEKTCVKAHKNRGHCRYFPCKQQKGTGKR